VSCATMRDVQPAPRDADHPPVPGFVAVVPAGGAGTRLWPLSRAGAPKFLHDLTGAGRTLLQQTWDRLLPLVGEDGLLVVTGRSHREAVRGQLPGLAARNLLGEPSPRDSMAAIGLAAAVLVRRDPEVVIGSFAADHVIADPAAFRDTVRQAVAVAREGWVCTIGITPTHPATGFGYIRSAGPLQVDGAPDALVVEEFVEKPDAGTAEGYLREGGYRWNAGMFVVRAATLLEHLRTGLPELHDGLVEAAAGLDAGDESALERVWPGLVRIAIDHAVAEPVAAAGGVAVVPGGFGWDDVGDWASLLALLPSTEGEPTVIGDGSRVLSVGSSGLVVPGSGRAVAVVGLEDVVVVDTPDALLVTRTEHAQRVKDVVERLRGSGGQALL
jgi:mannose-1-phosphate guanylyltransferase